jgi:hypothetical protein
MQMSDEHDTIPAPVDFDWYDCEIELAFSQLRKNDYEMAMRLNSELGATQ